MEQPIYLLDTNTASYLIKGKHNSVRARLQSLPMHDICISVITEAELRHGVAKVPEAKHLPERVEQFLRHVTVLPWESSCAQSYAHLRASCERKGCPLSNLDMLIAAHAMAVDAILVTHDKGFDAVREHIRLEDWVD